MSEPTQTSWRPSTAWAGLAVAGRAGQRDGEAGVRLGCVENAGLATVIARQDRHAALAVAIEERFGVGLAPPGRATFGTSCDIVWSAPGQWLVVWRQGNLLAALSEVCAGAAAVTDQASSRALVEISGPNARDALAKGFAIDLHPPAFMTGRAAATAVAHMSVQIWQTSDLPCFVIAVPRSFAGSFWSWLTTSVAAYGYEVASLT